MHLEELGIPSQITGTEHYTHASGPNPRRDPSPPAVTSSRPLTAEQACPLWSLPMRLRPYGARRKETLFPKDLEGEDTPVPG